jgi:hypothetical protein
MSTENKPELERLLNEKCPGYQGNGSPVMIQREDALSFIHSLLLILLDEISLEEVDEDEALFADDPDKKLGEGYSIGYNQAKADLDAKISAIKQKYGL